MQPTDTWTWHRLAGIVVSRKHGRSMQSREKHLDRTASSKVKDLLSYWGPAVEWQMILDTLPPFLRYIL